MLQDNELLYWCEPDDEIWFVCARDAVALQREAAMQHSGYVYTNSTDALGDFIAVHWAQTTDKP